MIMHHLATPTRTFGSTILKRQQQHYQSVSTITSRIPTVRSLASLATQDEEPAQQLVSHSLLILGKPGGGKGTISKKILNDFPQFRHVSTGDELRQHVRNGTELGKEAKKYMDGKLSMTFVHLCIWYVYL